MAQNQLEKAFRIETGMYKPKWITKWREEQMRKYVPYLYDGKILPEVNLGKSKKDGLSRQNRADVLKSLALIPRVQ
mgnify:CR=1 FL=1